MALEAAEQQAPARLADVLGAFALAGDLAIGQPAGHTYRACYIAMRIAQAMELSALDAADVYYTSLLVHSGATAYAPQLATFLESDELVAQWDLSLCGTESARESLGWVRRHVAPRRSLPVRVKRGLQMLVGSSLSDEVEAGAADVRSRIAQRLGLPAGTSQALYYASETYDGKGPCRLKGEAVPAAARVAGAATVLEVFASSKGRAAVRSVASSRAGRSLDPEVAEAFLVLAKDGGFWEGFDGAGRWEQIQSLEPQPRMMDEAALEEATLAFADFADLKSAHGAGHCRAVGNLAEAVAGQMRLGPADCALVRRAGYVHDVGQVGVPVGLLRKAATQPRRMTAAERERFRLHPHQTERVLSVVPALAKVAAVAGLHHEQPDGNGYYHRGLFGPDLPSTARVLAMANAYHGALASARRRDAERALNEMQAAAGSRYDVSCVEALEQVVRSGVAPRKHVLPGPLTEREVEMLRLLARGMSDKQIASRLGVSERTVRQHLRQVCREAGVSSRAGVVLWTMEQELLEA